MKKITLITWIMVSGLIFMNCMMVSGQDENKQIVIKKLDRLEEIEKEQVLQELATGFDWRAQAEEFAQQAKIMAQEKEFMARAFQNVGRNSSQLMLSKSYDGKDAENTGVFQIEEPVRQIRFSIDGSVKEGKIIIKLLLPGGEVFKELTIDESADIRFSQSITVPEEKNKYTGNWKYVIKAVKARGNYRLSINTN